jgi:isopentenyl-diphosphate Delta-isomerase
VTAESLAQESRSDVAISAEATSAPPVILVDEHDREVGLSEKIAAHERGVLHRAVSVFAFDADGAMLIQRRARGKYHSGGLWSNSACTHPRVGESNEEAARRCLRDEMGLECEALDRAFAFIYRAQVSATLVEHELDHVFVARIAQAPSPNVDEVEAWRLLSLTQVQREVADDPSRFSAWFPLALARLVGASTRSPLMPEATGEGAHG